VNGIDKLTVGYGIPFFQVLSISHQTFKQKPFVQQLGDGWAYHSLVRSQMLHYKLRESPQGWVALHERLENYYQNLLDNSKSGEEQKQYTTVLDDLTLEVVYHRLCQARYKQVPITYDSIADIIASLPGIKHFGLAGRDPLITRCMSTCVQAIEDSNVLSEFKDYVRKASLEESRLERKLELLFNHVEKSVKRGKEFIERREGEALQEATQELHKATEIMNEGLDFLKQEEQVHKRLGASILFVAQIIRHREQMLKFVEEIEKQIETMQGIIGELQDLTEEDDAGATFQLEKDQHVP